jgi:hypothetical protein
VDRSRAELVLALSLRRQRSTRRQTRVRAAAALLLVRRSGANPGALEGTKGLIVGEVKRWDEREIVFTRNAFLQPGSEQYDELYGAHPEWEELDARRSDLFRLLGPGRDGLRGLHEGPSPSFPKLRQPDRQEKPKSREPPRWARFDD